MKPIALLLVTIALSGCTAQDTATRALQGAGYSNIQIGGYAIMGCSEDDTFHTKFTAQGPTGKSVSGVVCSGVFKGATIRTN